MNLLRVHTLLFAGWLSAPLTGCSVGRSLVGELENQPLDLNCVPHAGCDAEYAVISFDPEELRTHLPGPCDVVDANCAAETSLEAEPAHALRLENQRILLTVENRATDPIALVSPSITNTRVTVEGPVRLDIAGGYLRNAVFEARSAGAELHIRDSDLAQVSASGFDRVRILRTATKDLLLEANDVALENVRLDGAEIHADWLLFGGGSLWQSIFHVDVAHVYSASIAHLRVARCGALTLTDSYLENAWLSACKREPLLLFKVQGTRAHYIGDLRAVDSGLTHGIFSAGTAQLWESSVASSFMCGDSTFRLDLGSRTPCMTCEPNDAATRASCFEGNTHDAPSTPCEPLKRLPKCEGKFPQAPQSGFGSAVGLDVLE